MYVGEAIGPGERSRLEHLARYLLRAPASLERMRYNPEAGNRHNDFQERPVVYYGLYANASRLGRSHRKRAGDSETSVWIAESPTRRSWTGSCVT